MWCWLRWATGHHLFQSTNLISEWRDRKRQSKQLIPGQDLKQIPSECICNTLLYVKNYVKIIYRENGSTDKQGNEDECEQIREVRCEKHPKWSRSCVPGKQVIQNHAHQTDFSSFIYANINSATDVSMCANPHMGETNCHNVRNFKMSQHDV
jgi:hypothetical protein